MDYIKFLTPLIAEIERLLKSLGAAGKPYFQQHIESFLKTAPKTVVNRPPTKEGEQPEIIYVAAFNWLSYPLNSNLDLFTDGRPPNKYELPDLAFFRLAVLYDGFHQRPGRDKIYFNLQNPPDDLAHNIAIGYWDEVKRLVEKEGRQGEVEAVFNQDLRLVENDCKDDEDEESGLPNRPYDDIDNPQEFAHGLQNILNNRILKIIKSPLDYNTKENLKRQASAIINRIDQYRDNKAPQELGMTELIKEIGDFCNRLREEIKLAKSTSNLASTKQNDITTEKWYRNRTIQAALISVIALIIISAIGWFLNSHSKNLSISSQKNDSTFINAETKGNLSPAVMTYGPNSPVNIYQTTGQSDANRPK